MLNAIMEYYDVDITEAKYMSKYMLDEFEKDFVLQWYLQKHNIEY